MKNSLKIIQANLQRSKSATAETLCTMQNNDIDIALFQEPYCYKSGSTTFSVPGLRGLTLVSHSSARFLSCIVIKPDLNVVHLAHLSNPYVAVVSIHRPSLSPLFAISVYCPPNDNLRPYLEYLQSVLDNLRGQCVLIGGDFNTRSTIWHDTISDRKSPLLEEFILTNDLHIQNEAGNPATFQTVNGSSNIDLTLCSTDCSLLIQSWKVVDGFNTADHRPISFLIGLQAHGLPAGNRESANIRLDFESITIDEIAAEMTEIATALMDSYPVLVSPSAVEGALKDFYFRIDNLLSSKAKRRKIYPHRPDWWNSKIERRRKIYLAKKSLLYKNRDPDKKQFLAEEMARAKTSFKSLLRKEQERSWTSFVKKDLGENPWGVVYKLATEKFNRLGALASFEKGNQHTLSPEESMSFLLESLLPDDSQQDESPEQEVWRQDFNTCSPRYTTRVEEVTEEELSQLVSRLKQHKAPGADKLKGKIIKLLHPFVSEFMVHVFNSCLRISYFPKCWKKGVLKVLLKDTTGDPSSVKNYRPITLLTEYGKMFEKVIRSRLFMAAPAPFHSSKQYGFIPGKSAVDAIKRYLEIVQDSNTKYTASLFIDISGAFDNVWWPAMLKSLRRKHIPDYLVALIKSYVTDRSVEYTNGEITISKECTKGCPQGSVLGPTLWNSVLDTFLTLPTRDGVDMVAYADDIVIVVQADNRLELKQNLHSCMENLKNWASLNKLKLSASKSKIMVNRSPPRCHNRDLNVKVDGKSLQTVKVMKYLGVHIDHKLTFTPHIEKICEKARRIIFALGRKTFITWNIPIAESLHTIYRCCIIPIMAFGSEVWAHRLHITKIRTKLNSIYGLASKLIIQGYRSVSNEAAGVIAGIPPLDLVLAQVNYKKVLRKEEETHFLQQNLNRREFDNLSQIKEYLSLLVNDHWQYRWENSQKGRTTYAFIPTVPESPRHSFTRESTQTLTGHGNFQVHLHRIGKSSVEDCRTCNKQDDPLHRIRDCIQFREERAELILHFNGIVPQMEQLSAAPLHLLAAFAKDPGNLRTSPPPTP
jgi:hypothetical protein